MEVELLPFLKPKPQTGVIIKNRKSDEPVGQEEDSNERDELEMLIEEAIRAFSAKDVKKLAEHVEMIHDCLHEYMSAPDANDFASQNEKAGEEQE